jgi:hypothetical protein
MAGLDTLFQNVGPTTAALQGGVDQVAAEKAAASEQAMRQAQMDEVLQRTSQAKDLHPLALEDKRISNQSAQLKANADKAAFRSELVGQMIPLVEKAPPAARLALMRQFSEENGLPMSEAHLQQFGQIPPDKLPAFLRQQRDNDIKNSEKYRQAWDVAELNRKSAEKIAAGHDATSRYTADQRANAAAAKNKGVATIDEQVKTGKMSAEKAAVAFYGAAQMEQDPTERQRLLEMSASYEKLAMNLKNASAAGRVDVGAAANLPTQTISPALTPPAPAAPAAAPGHSLADVQKMYPGVNADQLRKAYKDKFGVDLK